MIYLCHQIRLDILVRNLRSSQFRTPDRITHPYFTFIIEPTSKAFPSAAFTYDAQDEMVIDSVILYAFLFSSKKTIGGLPNQVWSGNCRELIPNRTIRLARSVGVKVSNRPELTEFHETLKQVTAMLDQKLWSRLPGYLGAEAEQRELRPKAELTIAELDQEFWNFIDYYHHQKQETLGISPLEFWLKNYSPMSLEPTLACRLKTRVYRWVFKGGKIHYHDQVFWYRALAFHQGERVMVYGGPRVRPDHIEVYLLTKDKRPVDWLCTATRLDNPLT